MSSINGKIIGDSFVLENKDVKITGRIVNDEIMCGLIKLNESKKSNIQNENSNDNKIPNTGEESGDGLNINLIPINIESTSQYLSPTFFSEYGDSVTSLVGFADGTDNYIKFPPVPMWV